MTRTNNVEGSEEDDGVKVKVKAVDDDLYRWESC